MARPETDARAVADDEDDHFPARTPGDDDRDHLSDERRTNERAPGAWTTRAARGARGGERVFASRLGRAPRVESVPGGRAVLGLFSPPARFVVPRPGRLGRISPPARSRRSTARSGPSGGGEPCGRRATADSPTAGRSDPRASSPARRACSSRSGSIGTSRGCTRIRTAARRGSCRIRRRRSGAATASRSKTFRFHLVFDGARGGTPRARAGIAAGAWAVDRPREEGFILRLTRDGREVSSPRRCRTSP